MSALGTRLARALIVLVAGAASLELAAALSDLAPPRTGDVRLCGAFANDELFSDASPIRFHPRWMWEPRSRAREAALDEVLYRGPAKPLAPGSAVRVAVLGGSFAWGVGVSAPQVWPALLERELLAAGFEVEVLDFSVPDYTVVQGERYYAGRVEAWRPDVVVACFGGIHESESAPGGISDDDRMECVQARGGSAEPFHERFAAARCIATAFGRPATMPWPGRANLFGRNVRVEPARYRDALAGLARTIEHDGARLVLLAPVLHPGQVSERRGFEAYPAALRELAGELSVPLVDPGPALAGVETTLLFDEQRRCTARAHELTAHTLAHAMRAGDLLRRGARD